MLRLIFSALLVLTLSVLAGAQQSAQPPVKVNVLNVCTPSSEEQQEIASALGKVPKLPSFGPDFEVSRGRSTMEERPELMPAAGSAQFSGDAATASWVRIRHEYSPQAMFSTVQYSFSVDNRNMVETLVFHVRDPKELMELAIEDSASTVTSPATMLQTNTPASRIKLERFGKSSVVLARCFASQGGQAPDQSAYEPLFRSASAILANYRGLLAADRMVPQELARIPGASGAKLKPATKTGPGKSAPPNK